jgi:hypothetical protein
VGTGVEEEEEKTKKKIEVQECSAAGLTAWAFWGYFSKQGQFLGYLLMNLGAILRGLHKGAASRSWGRVWRRSWWEYEERGFHGTSEASDITLVSQTLKIASLVDAFRSRGHFVASLGMCFGPNCPSTFFCVIL